MAHGWAERKITRCNLRFSMENQVKKKKNTTWLTPYRPALLPIIKKKSATFLLETTSSQPGRSLAS